ncbi:MAG: hypothetical protein NW208_06920 [Bryobacter sp.]|nr:hypothetical protein [Bryobacter sp.]
MPLVLEGSHLTDEVIELYCLGLLENEQEVATVEEHLLYCGYCQDRLAKSQNYVDAFKDAAKQVAQDPPESSGKSFLRAWPIAVVAAGLALVVAVPQLQQLTRSPQTLALESYRSLESISAEANRKLALKPNLEGIDSQLPLELQIVSANGEKVAAYPLANRTAAVLVQPLPVGRYWVRLLRTDANTQLREFALEVR